MSVEPESMWLSQCLCVEPENKCGANVYVWSQCLCGEPVYKCGASVYLGSHSISVEPESMCGASVYVYTLAQPHRHWLLT